jgi:alpha-D-xyloside xylohydrolase
MVCPVTKPMYYRRNSEPIRQSAKRREVYLPKGGRWYDFWTEKAEEGGRTIEADAPLETIPLFVRAGAILPMSPVMQFVDEIPDAPYEIRIYRGADGRFALYEDAGDNYDYETGVFAIVRLFWDDDRGELVIGGRQGSFPTMAPSREFRLILISPQGRETKIVRYTGREMRVRVSNSRDSDPRLDG